jgi:hypothetical protein
MDQNRFGGWTQLLGNLAIVAGIGIVIFELNQNKELAYAQMFAQGHADIDNQFLAMQGEDPRQALFKAEFCPSELAGEDVVTLSAYYERWVSSWQRIYRTNRIAALERPWRLVVQKDVRRVFSSRLARRWLNAYLDESEKILMAEEMKEVVVQTLAEPPGSLQKDLYIALLPGTPNSLICGATASG